MHVRNKRTPLLAWVGFAWFFAILVANAWVSDDAFILYRSMEQLLAGNGPVWNAHERVQVYTGVAWFWLGHLVRQATDDYFLLMLSMSAACSAAMLALLRRWVANDAAWLVLVLALSASRGLVDYGTSGLGHSLVNLVAVAIMLMWRKVASSPTPAGLARLIMLASIVPLVRHDMALLVVPACLHAMWVGRRCLTPGRWCLLLCAASLPLACWTAFSLAYYGFPLPNTYYAKAAAGIPRLELLGAGLGYYVAAWLMDPVVLPFIAVGLVLMFARKLAPLAAGVVLHLLYVLWVGGDHMLTRFLVTDLVVACAGAAVVLRPGDLQAKNARSMIAVCVLTLLSVGALLHLVLSPDTDTARLEGHISTILLLFLAFSFLLANSGMGRLARGRLGSGQVLAVCFLLVWQVADPYSPARSQEVSFLGGVNGVGWDRQVWRESASMGAWLEDKAGSLLVGKEDRAPLLHLSTKAGLPMPPEARFPLGTFALRGQAARMFDASSGVAIGQHGLWAGTEPIVVDRIALADPYLARTRYQGKVVEDWIAHWHRGLPLVHPAAIMKDGTAMPTPDANTLEGDLAVATRTTPLLVGSRLAAIMRLNSGRYGIIEPEGALIPQDSREVFYFHGPSGVWLPYEASGQNAPVRVGGR